VAVSEAKQPPFSLIWIRIQIQKWSKVINTKNIRRNPQKNIDLMVFKAETTGVVTEIFGKHPKGRNLEGGPVNAVGASRSGPGNFLEKQDTEIWEEAPFY
jgi:hypothetical protein